MRAPAALVAVPLTAGCALGLIWGDRVEPAFAFCAAGAGAIGVCAVVALVLDDLASDAAAAIVATALVIGVSMGATAARRAYHPPLLRWFAAAGGVSPPPIALEGRLREDASLTPSGVSLLIEVERVFDTAAGTPASGGVRLSVAGDLAWGSASTWRSGRRVRVTAALREPTIYIDPGVPDERRALLRRGIALVGTVKSAALVEVVAPGSRVDEYAASLRAWARTTLGAAVGRWSDRSAGVAAAIVIGDRTGLAQDDERRLQEAGTYHVIAISGGNIAILTLLMLTAATWLRAPPRLAAAGAICVLLFYGRITGASASVERAIAAAVVVLAGRVMEQRGSAVNVLAAAAILGLGAAPAAVFDPGFVLSFGATLAILVGVPRIERRLHGVPLAKWIRPAIALLAATLSAELALTPISAALFSRVTVAGLVLNFVAIPLMTVVQAGALASLALGPLQPTLSSACGYTAHLGARGLIDSARIVEVFPWLARDVAPCAWSLIAAYYVALILSLSPWRVSRAGAVAAGLLGLTIVIGPHAAARDRVDLPRPRTLRVVFIDVGQGDATLVCLPDGRAILIDAGGLPVAPLQEPQDGPAFDVGERVVARSLRAFGVRGLETFVVTHPDPDHLGGGRAILRHFVPREVWEGVPVPPHPARRLFRDLARADGRAWRTVTAGDRVELAGVEIAVVHPPVPDWERQRVRNDDSVVIALRYGAVSVILPGDIGKEGESLALRHLEPAPVTILKAPHHGSATSSTPPFLAATRPRVVIVSAGRNNRFGHPAPSVLERYRALGAEVFSTAKDGAVMLDTDGKTVEIRGWTGRKLQIGER
jgi:competence protein ComEC